MKRKQKKVNVNPKPYVPNHLNPNRDLAEHNVTTHLYVNGNAVTNPSQVGPDIYIPEDLDINSNIIPDPTPHVAEHLDANGNTVTNPDVVEHLNKVIEIIKSKA